MSDLTFPDFDLKKLIDTVFKPGAGERVAILIDLKDPTLIKDFQFLKDPSNTVQRNAVEYFYKPFKEHVLEEMQLKGGELFAYELTGGSNLDLPEVAYSEQGDTVSFEKSIFPSYDLILCISTYSATAPLTAFSKAYGFRGATLHGVNDVILSSGLCVNYEEISEKTEKMRKSMSGAEAIDIVLTASDRECRLTLDVSNKEPQKSHGLCRQGPDIANLPAGEVYFIPEKAEGTFPFKFEDGSTAILSVSNGVIHDGELLSGDAEILSSFLRKIETDPRVGQLGELGFGTQCLPVSGEDIQDEKILGTVHIATGRNDHLSGTITPEMFQKRENASHDDILFSPEKTPEFHLNYVSMTRDGETIKLLENYKPAAYLTALIGEK